MEILDNVGRLLGDDLKRTIEPGAKLRVAASCFSIYVAKRKPLRAVFRDSSFASDSAKINVEQIFKLLSPTTEVKSL